MTVTTKLFVARSTGLPLSETIVVSVYWPGPYASVGVQLIRPLESIAAPAGGFCNV